MKDYSQLQKELESYSDYELLKYLTVFENQMTSETLMILEQVMLNRQVTLNSTDTYTAGSLALELKYKEIIETSKKKSSTQKVNFSTKKNVNRDFKPEQLAIKGIRIINYVIDFSIIAGITKFLDGDIKKGGIYIFSFLMYYTLFEWFTNGKTIGKYITKTRAIKDNGELLTLKEAFMRSLIRLIPIEIFVCIITDYGYGWHDRWTNTIVIPDSEFHFEHYSLDEKPKTEMPISKNSVLYPEDGLGKMERGTVDNDKIKNE